MKARAFVVQPGLPPAVAVLPCLEVVVAVQPGDDRRALGALWRRLTAPFDAALRFAHDSVRWRGELGKNAAASTDRSIGDAFELMTRGPHASIPAVDWAFCTFGDGPAPDRLSVVSASCAIGWADQAGTRGVSLRVTGDDTPATFAALEQLAREIARTEPPAWRWMTVGHRFVPVCALSPSFPDALTIVRQRARRFRGVDVGDPFGFYLSAATQRLRSVGFLTCLSAALPGRADLPATAPEGSPLEISTEGGALLVRAGRAPAVLDTNRRDPVAAYRAADAFCAPVRASAGINFFTPWDEESTALWLDRLQLADQPSPAPDNDTVEAR